MQPPLYRSCVLHRAQLLRLCSSIHAGTQTSSIRYPPHRFSHPLYLARLEHGQSNLRRSWKSSYLLGIFRLGKLEQET